MRIIRTVEEMRAEAETRRRSGDIVGLVPTMGFFHEGHLSLMRRARGECGMVVVSLFVNPTQFGPGEDLAAYPRDFERDCARAGAEGVDAMFAPEAGEMYAGDHATFVNVERLTGNLCGASRPVHFRGVATVVAKLFNACRPQRAYFGLKDYQQVRVIETMIRDLNFDIELVRCPIVREPDGVAMSSRNSYLFAEERRAATILRRSLVAAGKRIEEGERDGAAIARQLREAIETEPLASVDYAEVVDAESLAPLGRIHGAALLAIAVRIGRARLIDNLAVETVI
ncbi:MAG TPA: pantoate--beta-alanine ligase [Bryobacteraceae bacterium]|jgi:pantoate--beta-alanine ligase